MRLARRTGEDTEAMRVDEDGPPLHRPRPVITPSVYGFFVSGPKPVARCRRDRPAPLSESGWTSSSTRSRADSPPLARRACAAPPPGPATARARVTADSATRAVAVAMSGPS
jgi:hypothetical protein